MIKLNDNNTLTPLPNLQRKTHPSTNLPCYRELPSHPLPPPPSPLPMLPGWVDSMNIKAENFILSSVASHLENLCSFDYRIFPSNRLPASSFVIITTVVPIRIPVLRTEHVSASTSKPHQSQLPPATLARTPICISRPFQRPIYEDDLVFFFNEIRSLSRRFRDRVRSRLVVIVVAWEFRIWALRGPGGIRSLVIGSAWKLWLRGRNWDCWGAER